ATRAAAAARAPPHGRRLRGRPVPLLEPGSRAPPRRTVAVAVPVPGPVLPRAARPGRLFGDACRPTRAPAVVRVRPARLAPVVEAVRGEAAGREAVGRPPGPPPPPLRPAPPPGAPAPVPPLVLASVRHVRPRRSALGLAGPGLAAAGRPSP